MRVVKVSDSIISPLGFSVEENFDSLLRGGSALRKYNRLWGLPFEFMASIFDEEELNNYFIENIDITKLPHSNCTKFEKIALLSAFKAISSANIDPKSHRILFILSSTKGNIELLSTSNFDPNRVLLGNTAQMIARYFGNTNKPIVVSNACISGLCAQIEAMRFLKSGSYDFCVVIGADVLSPFIVSGFNSLKALSTEPCKPFSINRNGLNLGEAAATIIYSTVDDGKNNWEIVCGATRNDANHISGPSRTGDGSLSALNYVLQYSGCKIADIAFANVHGTATPYNDEMESIALERAGLSDLPINSLKGFYGHTLGAAGVLEVILSMCSLDKGKILPTHGFDSLGVSGNINVISTLQETNKHSFLKLLSGFGGCNSSAIFTKLRKL